MRTAADQISRNAIGRAPTLWRVAIVGCGRVGETCHLPALGSLGDRARVVALVDPDEHRRRRVGGMFDIARTFPDVGSMLADDSLLIDIVAICTPAQHHADATIAAIRAGKHVLIEKPLALTLDDADRILEEAARVAPRVSAFVGFNLRHHRLVQRARARIASGAIGELQLVRTIWSSGIRGRMQLPAWRDRRDAGGGVFNEIAVHHVDLIRHLTGAEVERVVADSQHGDGDDESATLSLSLSNGASASSVFTERSADANELEFFGTKGRLAFSIYRFDSLTVTSPGSYGGRAAQLIATLKDLPEVWPILRRGGDFRETYRRQWLAMFEALERGDPGALASIEDGREALRVIFSAAASANTRQPVAIADAPRSPQPVVRERCADAIVVDARTNGPQLTAILSTRDRFEHIRRTVHHLRAQTARDQIELMIVCPSKPQLQLDLAEVAGFAGHRIVEVGMIVSAARNYAAGVRAASAPIVVFCEDHAFPDPTWAESLILAHRGGGYAAVGPVVRNANPSTATSWADCLIGYGPWLEPLRPAEPQHLPGHNSSYQRDVLLGYGERLDEMLEAETVLQWDLRAKGQRLYLDPCARVAHTNFADFWFWTRVQFHAGRMFGATRAIAWPLWKRAVFTCGAPLIPLVRLKRVASQTWRVARGNQMPWTTWPALLWGLAFDGLGQMTGYALGAGASRSKVSQYEFERVRYITAQDRQALADAEPVATMRTE